MRGVAVSHYGVLWCPDFPPPSSLKLRRERSQALSKKLSIFGVIVKIDVGRSFSCASYEKSAQRAVYHIQDAAKATSYRKLALG